jgi:regulator of protease activity HflC (stomatin/prohibitin superfamily)
MTIEGSSVPDLKGSPMNVSAIVNYKIEDALKSTFAVRDYERFIYNQSLEVMRTVCSKFAYRSGDDQPCLMTDSYLIGHYMAGLLQERCEICGVKIEKMELMEVAYHTEVAQSLLLVQQA